MIETQTGMDAMVGEDPRMCESDINRAFMELINESTHAGHDLLTDDFLGATEVGHEIRHGGDLPDFGLDGTIVEGTHGWFGELDLDRVDDVILDVGLEGPMNLMPIESP